MNLNDQRALRRTLNLLWELIDSVNSKKTIDTKYFRQKINEILCYIQKEESTKCQQLK